MNVQITTVTTNFLFLPSNINSTNATPKNFPVTLFSPKFSIKLQWELHSLVHLKRHWIPKNSSLCLPVIFLGPITAKETTVFHFPRDIGDRKKWRGYTLATRRHESVSMCTAQFSRFASHNFSSLVAGRHGFLSDWQLEWWHGQSSGKLCSKTLVGEDDWFPAENSFQTPITSSLVLLRLRPNGGHSSDSWNSCQNFPTILPRVPIPKLGDVQIATPLSGECSIWRSSFPGSQRMKSEVTITKRNCSINYPRENSPD